MIDIYGEIAEPSRRYILGVLRHGPKTVTEIVEATGLKQPNVSNHLARMRLRGTVRAAKVGRRVFYSFGSPEVESVVLATLVEFAEPDRNPNLQEVVSNYAALAIAGDEVACGKLVDRTIASGRDLLTLYLHLIEPTMGLVGSWWQEGVIDTGQEHAATAIALRSMSRILQLSPTRHAKGRTAVLGCTNGSRHELGLRMIGDYLRVEGWATVFLGCDVPDDSFLSAYRRHRPQATLVSCGSEDSASTAIALIHKLKDLDNRHQVVLGGLAVSQSPESFALSRADFVSPNLAHFANEAFPEMERRLEALDM